MIARLLRLTRTLHFRLTALFLLLACAVVAGYYYLLDVTVFDPYDDATEEHWYEDLADDEMDSLAVELATAVDDRARLQALLMDCGRRIADYEAELVLFDASGRQLTSSDPDSLARAVPRADVDLLRDMSDGHWDYSSYPDTTALESYPNRIFHVARVVPTPGDDDHPAAYLAASFEPVAYTEAEMDADERRLFVQAVVMLLIYATASALIIMAWTSRRVARLSHGVQLFTDGDLQARVPESRSDEIGVLGQNINAMAVRIESMVAELRHKEQFQRQLVANISHDLRTPLASLRGYLETLGLRQVSLTEKERQRFLDNITAKLNHLDRLIDHALVLSRLDSGQDTFHCEDFSAGELCSAVLERNELVASGRGVELVLELADHLPDVHADPLQVGRVLQNLVENGIKFTPAGGRVTVAARAQDGHVEITVSDTGRGIAPDDLPHVFERFYTGDKSRSGSGQGRADADWVLGRSSGLGLAIARRIVEEHGSEITVRSEPDRGSVFTFRLPAAPAVRPAVDA